MKKPVNVDEYINAAPEQMREALNIMRALIRKAAPKAEETIAYGMPAYKLNGPLVYFGANKSHTGFYPTPSAITAFAQELENYTTSKGAIQFPMDKPIPKMLVKKIVKYRVKENEEKKK